MKKSLKILFIVLGIVVILGLIFFVVDYNRVQNQEKPIFCIQNPAGIISDGGTIEYFGLGYKVIDFHTLAGFDDIKIGTWFMDYNDFEQEMKEYEKKFEEELQQNESTIVNSQSAYTKEQLESMSLEYFMKNNTDTLDKEMYSVGISEDVIDEYKNQDMVVIEIRHINNNINNTLDARFYINIYTAKGFDDLGNEIDLNILE